jgi:cyclopropane fatty-acyl-phospholipid synthase-like methyltransferase
MGPRMTGNLRDFPMYIDYQYWMEYWDNWPREGQADNASNLRPPDYNPQEAFKEIHKILRFNKKYRVLDAGCGTGNIAQYIAPRVDELAAIDRSAAIISLAEEKLKNVRTKSKKKVKVNVMDVLGISYPRKTFDIVMSHAVVQYIHVNHMMKYIQDMMYVTKDGGKVFIGDIIPVNKKFDGGNTTQIPESYWKETWGQYKPKKYKANYEGEYNRYHILLIKPKKHTKK